MDSENKRNRWEASATIAADADWFTQDIGPSHRNRGSKFTLLMAVPTSTVVEVDIDDGTTEKTATLNGGTALTADAWYVFHITVPWGYTFNIQHKTGTQNVACIVDETVANSDF